NSSKSTYKTNPVRQAGSALIPLTAKSIAPERRLLSSGRPLSAKAGWKHEVSATYENAWYGGVVKNGQEEMDARYANIYTKFKQEIASKQIEVHRGYSDIVLAQFPDEYFDWVYIDGNHLYEYVKKDIELSFRKTKIGGYITGDDYIEGGWWKGGVKKAVDEYARAIPEHLIEIRDRQFVFCNKF
nr:class I SAM-dependent methyltransferase [Xenococcaceae cyanobacterium MO_188.B29]